MVVLLPKVGKVSAAGLEFHPSLNPGARNGSSGSDLLPEVFRINYRLKFLRLAIADVHEVSSIDFEFLSFTSDTSKMANKCT
jgi:hypothetical protein